MVIIHCVNIRCQLLFSFQSVTLDKLPDKVLLRVFSFVRQKELGKIARVCRKFRVIAYDSRLWKSVSLRPDYSGLHINSMEALLALIGIRFGPTLSYMELPSELITPQVLHELSNKCPNLKYLTLDFSSAMQLHDFNELNAFPCNLRSLCICLSEVIFLEGFMRRIYSCLSSLEVLHLIGKIDLPRPNTVLTVYCSQHPANDWSYKFWIISSNIVFGIIGLVDWKSNFCPQKQIVLLKCWVNCDFVDLLMSGTISLNVDQYCREL